MAAEHKTLKAAYLSFGITVPNARRSWAAQIDTGKVVLLLHPKLFTDANFSAYEQPAPLPTEKWPGRFENKYRIKLLQYVEDNNPDKSFETIIRINSYEWKVGPTMELTYLDPETGAFRARQAALDALATLNKR